MIPLYVNSRIYMIVVFFSDTCIAMEKVENGQVIVATRSTGITKLLLGLLALCLVAMIMLCVSVGYMVELNRSDSDPFDAGFEVCICVSHCVCVCVCVCVEIHLFTT